MNCNSSKLFVTMYNRTMNIDILKSPGKIPYYVSKASNGFFKSRLVTFKVDEYTYHKDLQDHLEFVSIMPRSAFDRKFLLSLLSYIAQNAGSIDVLQLYQIRCGTLFKALVYKVFNPKGFLYIKLDAEWTLKSYFPRPKFKGIRKYLDRYRRYPLLFRSIVRLSDLISIETQELDDYLVSQNYKTLNKKLFRNPYGIDIDEMKANEKPVIHKENIIMTVGRISTDQKNTEMLLSALGIIGNLGNWHVYIVGPIDTSFDHKIKQFHLKYPSLEQNVHFTGNISDRKLLCEYYQRSRCFVLTSRFESWGIVLTEAAYYKNYIISTDVGCIRELLIGKEFGSIVPQNDPQRLAQALRLILDKNVNLPADGGEKLRNHCVEHFAWEKVAKTLLLRLGEKGFACAIQQQNCQAV